MQAARTLYQPEMSTDKQPEAGTSQLGYEQGHTVSIALDHVLVMSYAHSCSPARIQVELCCAREILSGWRQRCCVAWLRAELCVARARCAIRASRRAYFDKDAAAGRQTCSVCERRRAPRAQARERRRQPRAGRPLSTSSITEVRSCTVLHIFARAASSSTLVRPGNKVCFLTHRRSSITCAQKLHVSRILVHRRLLAHHDRSCLEALVASSRGTLDAADATDGRSTAQMDARRTNARRVQPTD